MADCINKKCNAFNEKHSLNCGATFLSPMSCKDYLTSDSDAGANVPLDRLVMPYAVEQRLRFIDFLLSQYGHVNRSAIMDYFGIGAATATRDFKAYKGLRKDNVIYDDVDKSYHRSNRFKRVWA